VKGGEVSMVTHVDERSGRNTKEHISGTKIISSLCMRLLVVTFSTKKYHKIYSTK